MVTNVNKAVSSFIGTSEDAQVALIIAAQRSRMYQPRSEAELTAVSQYWASPQRVQSGNEALFTTRIMLPFETVPSFIINKKVLNYIGLLYIGQHDTEPLRTADFEEHGSAELKAILENTAEGGEVELGGALKCEALGHSLRHDKITPISEIIINTNNPMEGVVTFRVGKPVEAVEAVEAVTNETTV